MIALRVLYRVVGGHVHCRVFTGRPGAGANAGDLVFRREEWSDVRVAFECGGFDVLFDHGLAAVRGGSPARLASRRRGRS